MLAFLLLLFIGCDVQQPALEVLGRFSGEFRLVADGERVRFAVGCYEGEAAGIILLNKKRGFDLPTTLYYSAGPAKREIPGPVRLVGSFLSPVLQVRLVMPAQTLGPYSSRQTSEAVSVTSLCL